MSAYYILFLEKPDDMAAMDQYRKLAAPTLKGRDIRFIAAPSCELLTLEGSDVDGVIVIEFKSVAEARDWYQSPEYQTALKLRLGAVRSRGVIVAGLA
jgi:uncharacterized protein (DUF1330 family)